MLFLIVVGLLSSLFLAWVLTYSRRLRVRGSNPLQHMSKLPINEIQAITLCTSFLAQVKLHEEVWQKLGGFRGLGLLHNDAACLIEWWRSISKNIQSPGMLELNRKFYALGLVVFFAGAEAILLAPFRAFCACIGSPVPRFYTTLAISLYAEVQASVRTLCEAYRPDLIVFARENI